MTHPETDPLRAETRALQAALKEWQDYWGCGSPHDTHVSAGTSDKYARQLGNEQARANRLEHENERLQADLDAEKLKSSDWERLCGLNVEGWQVDQSRLAETRRDLAALREVARELVASVKRYGSADVSIFSHRMWCKVSLRGGADCSCDRELVIAAIAKFEALDQPPSVTIEPKEQRPA